MWQYVAVLFLVSQCQSFNVDVLQPIVRTTIQPDNYDDPVNRDMFGYKVGLYDSSNDGIRILVSAPRGRADRAPPNVGINRLSYGVIYNCDAVPGTCEGFTEGTSSRFYDTEANNAIQQKNGQFLGGTLKVGGNGVLVCAPRYIEIISTSFNPIGRCYYTYNRNLQGNFGILSPCNLLSGNTGDFGDQLASSVCTAGTSGDIIGDNAFSDEMDKVSIGVPGNRNWAGSIVIYTEQSFSGSNSGANADYGDPQDTPNSLFGYETIHYRIKGDNTGEPGTVTSAPGAFRLKGFIEFYTFIRGTTTGDPVQRILGTTEGSKFGASLAAVDLNGDGADEIIVGAPTYGEVGDVNIGQIHIYIDSSDEFILFTTINGMEQNAQFGYALGELGDIDDNGLEDFAVGAPFGTGSGTVYIYNAVGGDELIRQTQVIKGSELNLMFDTSLPMPRSFGISFSNQLDVDDNGYVDFAVGSYLSQQVYLLRSRPVANMSLSFSLSEEFLNLNQTPCSSDGLMYPCIQIRACFNYSGVSVGSVLNINYQFVIERRTSENAHFSRGFFMSNGNSRRSNTSTVMENMQPCIDDMILFRDGVEDQYTPLYVEFLMSMDDPIISRTNGNTTLSVASSGSVLRVIDDNFTQIPLVSNCGSDSVCTGDLAINASGSIEFEVDGVVDTNINSVSAGVVTAVRIPIQMRNRAPERAITPTITFDLPQGMDFIRAFDNSTGLAQVCRESNVSGTIQVECQMGLSFPSEETRVYIFRIQTRRITGGEGNLTITFTANSTTESGEQMDKVHPVDLRVTAEADVFIRSSFRPDSVQVGRSNSNNRIVLEARDLGPMVQGQFVVRNFGPSEIPAVRLDIFWPAMFDDNNFIIYPSMISGDSVDVTCDERNIDPLNYNNNTNRRRKRQSNDNAGGVDCRTGNCAVFSCNISNLRANESSTIRVTGFIDDASFVGTTILWNFVAKSNVSIIGAATEYITQPEDHQSDTDTAALQGIPPNLSTDSSDDGVEAWVIIVPIVVGIILIVVAAILLYFFGFFKRKKVNWEDEQNLAWQTPDATDGGTMASDGGTMPQKSEPSPPAEQEPKDATDV